MASKRGSELNEFNQIFKTLTVKVKMTKKSGQCLQTQKQSEGEEGNVNIENDCGNRTSATNAHQSFRSQ